MLADKTSNSSKLITQVESSSYEQYLDAKAEKDRRCEEHAKVVRACRRQQMNAYLSQKFCNKLKSTSKQSNSFEQIPDDPKPHSTDKENTPKGYRKRKNENPLKFDFSTGSATPNQQQAFFK